ncbi:polysaccharide deacetylase family protein [Gorillibacterium sp. CAU 1737]|uniref:polysaccharide deacetylase family protein n=1 Tax=Gorillibacterium sp. CAU 1737 TaxID=3140362 RepID=UPI00325FE024
MRGLFGKPVRSALAAATLALTLLAYPAASFAEAHSAEGAKLYQTLKTGQGLPPDDTTSKQAASQEATEEKVVYLTFDDGPSKLTPAVLDLLKQEQVKATFFALGELAEARPALVKRVVEEGHALGNHSYNHVYRELYSSFEGFWDQITRTEEVLFQITGSRTSLLRPPGGSYTNFDSFYFYLLEQAGYRVFDWNVDSIDASKRGVKASAILNAVVKAPLKNRMVVLMHDGAGHEETVKALPAIIKHFKDNGYRFERLDAADTSVQFRLGKPKWERTMGESEFAYLLEEARAHAMKFESEGKPQLVSGEKMDTEGARTADSPAGTSGDCTDHGEDGTAGHSSTPPVKSADSADEGTTETTDSTGSRQSGKTGNSASSGNVQTGNPVSAGNSQPSASSAQTGKTLTVLLNGQAWTLKPGEHELIRGRFFVSLPDLVSRMGGQAGISHGETAQIGLTRLTLDPSSHQVRVDSPGRGSVTAALVPIHQGANGELTVPLRTLVELLGGRIAGYLLQGDGGMVEAEWPIGFPTWWVDGTL